MKRLSSKITLRHLIVGVISLAFLFAVASSVYSSYKGNIKLLEKQSLEMNRVYAEKLAQMVDLFLDDTMVRLEYTSHNVAEFMDNQESLASH